MNQFEQKLLLKYLSSAKDKSIAFFGASDVLPKFIFENNLCNFNIAGIIDTNSRLCGTELFGYKIFTPETLPISPDLIIATTKNNYVQFYKNVQEITKKYFPSAELLPNIFAQSNIEKLASNKLFLVNAAGEKVQVQNIPGLNISWEGENSTIEISANPLPRFNNSSISIGTNCFCSIDSSIYSVSGLNVLIYAEHSILKIGKDFSVVGANIWLTCEENTQIKIGDDCMLAHGIIIRSSDGHTIYDVDSKQVTNKSKGVNIGNHVWIAQNVTILKNTNIPDNSVIAASSVVNKFFEEQNIVLSGTPASITKKGINWSRSFPDKFTF